MISSHSLDSTSSAYQTPDMLDLDEAKTCERIINKIELEMSAGTLKEPKFKTTKEEIEEFSKVCRATLAEEKVPTEKAEKIVQLAFDSINVALFFDLNLNNASTAIEQGKKLRQQFIELDYAEESPQYKRFQDAVYKTSYYRNFKEYYMEKSVYLTLKGYQEIVTEAYHVVAPPSVATPQPYHTATEDPAVVKYHPATSAPTLTISAPPAAPVVTPSPSEAKKSPVSVPKKSGVLKWFCCGNADNVDQDIPINHNLARQKK